MSTTQTLLQILKEVDYAQTISDIANKLYLSQPYISKILKENEDVHRVQLVNRTKPIELTNAGRTMISGLQAIIDEEDRLNDSLNAIANADERPIRIAVTDPFMSSTVTELVTNYYQSCDHQKIQVSLLADVFNNKEVLSNFDILLGKRLKDSNFKQLEMPQRQLNLFVTDHCDGYQPDQLYQKFSTDFFETLNMVNYVGLAGCDSFQRYVEMSFKKENIGLATTVLVPTATDALRAVNNLSQATTITTISTAELVFPRLNFNLIPLPANFITLDTTINYRYGAGSMVSELAYYLQQELSSSNEATMINEKRKQTN